MKIKENILIHPTSYLALMLVWAVVPAVSSCGREATEDYGDAIAFSASAEKVADSRSAGSVLVTTLNTDGSEIAVYGYHGGASDYSGKTPVFETDGAKRVYYRSSGNAGDSKWDYDYTGGADKVKWLRSDYYRFRAFYPYSLISKVNSSSNAEILALDYSLKEDDSDLMVAYTTRFPAGGGVGPVELEFKHALSALQFVVKKENPSETEKIKEFYLTGLYQTGGLVYTSSDAANMTGEQTLNWIPSVSDENDPVHHWIAAIETEYKEIDSDGVTVYDEDGFVFAIPMDGKDKDGLIVKTLPKIRANFRTDKGGTVLHAAMLPDIRWEPGKKYIYTITVKQATVSVVVTIKPWTLVEAGAEMKF